MHLVKIMKWRISSKRLCSRGSLKVTFNKQSKRRQIKFCLLFLLINSDTGNRGG